jgi:hypothetical protein
MVKSTLKIILRIITGAIGTSLFLGSMYYGYLVYFVRTLNPSDKLYYDGIERKLEFPPTIVRIFITDGAMWPGLGNSLLDLLIFWGLMLLSLLLFSHTFKD